VRGYEPYSITDCSTPRFPELLVSADDLESGMVHMLPGVLDDEAVSLIHAAAAAARDGEDVDPFSLDLGLLIRGVEQTA
jgi:hypothetical protein